MSRKRDFIPFLVLAFATTLLGGPAAGLAGEEQNRAAEVTLAVEGMTCGGCVAAVKTALKKTEGVSEYEVSLEKKEARVHFDPRKTEPEKIAAAVSKTGFKATVKDAKKQSSKGT